MQKIQFKVKIQQKCRSTQCSTSKLIIAFSRYFIENNYPINTEQVQFSTKVCYVQKIFEMKVKTQPKLAKEEENGAKNGSVSKTKPKIKTKQKNKVEEGGVPSRDPATLILQNRSISRSLLIVPHSIFCVYRFSEHPVHNLSLGQIGVGLVAILTQVG